MKSQPIFSQLQKGTTLANGKYVIENKIGEGGFSITYRAVQTGLNRAVCIKEYFLAGRCVRDVQTKTIHVQGTNEELFEKYRVAFVKEAQTLANLHYQGIVEVIDIFDENNTSYMVMPFIEGVTLQQEVDKNGPLQYPEAVNYIAQVADAVGYIHKRHILHRDIKPENIIITSDYKAVLIDFGSAREFEEDKVQSQTSIVTHGYAPTEQYTRDSRKGAYTDIYAIGATMYFMLTGKVPVEAAARITETMPEPKELNPDLPDEANRTIMKAMQLKAGDRHQSIAEFMDDLRNVRPSKQGGTKKETPSTQNVPPKEEQKKPVEKKKKRKNSKPEEPKPEKPKKKGTKTVLWLSLVAAVVVVALLFAFFGKSPHLMAAQSNVEEYNTTVSECYSLIRSGSNINPLPLIEARNLLETVIRPMEDAYSDAMAEPYNRSKNIENYLYPKLQSVAKAWADDARFYIKQNVSPDTIIKKYEYSLSIYDDPQVRDELREYKDSQMLKSLNDVETAE